VRCRLQINLVSERQFDLLLAEFAAANKSNIEIESVEIWSGGKPTCLITEREPFDVRVKLNAVRRTPCVDVGVTISRVDGEYIFWQSCGLVGQNIQDLEGPVEIRFEFTPNQLKSAQYLVSVTCANGWDVDQNYPYSEVFCRRINGCQFTIEREDPRLDYGQLNVRVPVRILREASARLAG
jgi:lipopolysaccharide transport system ATP-binding protein